MLNFYYCEKWNLCFQWLKTKFSMNFFSAFFCSSMALCFSSHKCFEIVKHFVWPEMCLYLSVCLSYKPFNIFFWFKWLFSDNMLKQRLQQGRCGHLVMVSSSGTGVGGLRPWHLRQYLTLDSHKDWFPAWITSGTFSVRVGSQTSTLN